GARACRAGGQGTVADVLSWRPGARSEFPGRASLRVFPEVIAAGEQAVGGAVASALEVARELWGRVGGLSPHAPYTAAAGAYRACRREAGRLGLPLMTHLAESPAEMEFCLGGGGEIPERLYRALGGEPPPSPREHPVVWLDRLGVLGPGTVLVHAVHLGPAEVDRVARRGAGVVLCPRSNRHLGVGVAPGRELLARGVAVGLGTDSRLSAGDLDLWQDAIAAVDDYGWSPAEAVAAATRGGPAVLGLADRGTFAPGRRADILALPLSPGADLWEGMLADPRPAALWLAGRAALDGAGVPGHP
ncbi:MAG: amidohydrolase family protein, partial [Deferrisomatales bacterium]